MSILKSIMHHWNSTSESYDTLHPETEYAQVTDFGEGTIAHLISSALVSTVTACSTGSVFGKLVEKLLDASGMRYNLTNSNAWYICMGSLFGGLIIQGGTVANVSANTTTQVDYPITFSSQTSSAVAVGSHLYPVIVTNKSTGSFATASTGTQNYVRWIAVGR